jgi:hypothetical protein
MNIQRRNFLRRAALGSAALLPASTLLVSKNGFGATPSDQLSAGDIGVLDLGMNNEYLEAEFYLRALTGNGLPSPDITGAGSPGNVIVNTERPVTFANPFIKAMARQLADDELAHVLDIRSTFASFGLTPPARPTIDFVNSFQLLSSQAGLNRHFDPLGNEKDFLLSSFFFEENGSTLLVAAIGVIENLELRSILASFLGDEAAHDGFVRLGLAQEHSQIISEANKIAQLKQKLAGSNTTIFQPLTDNQKLILVPADASAEVVALTPQQYMSNVFLSLNATAGGFFPNGLNLAN